MTRQPAMPAAEMKAEDPLFILYTSGSTGQPKGVLHTTGGYLVCAAMTHEYVFDYHDGDVYWCTADVGWVTGHSYIVYGPLANGATTLMFEGVPTYPDAGRFWEVCDKHKVNIFYTAPTAIRALMGAGTTCRSGTSADLRVLGSVGEPINPEAWEWYYNVVGEAVPDCRYLVADRNRRHHDHAAAGCDRLKPGSATRRSSAFSRNWSTMTATCLTAQPRAICASTDPGRARCARSTAITNASSRPISRITRASTSPVTAAGVTRTATTGLPVASMT